MCQCDEQLSQVVTANDTVINSPESLCVPCSVPPATVSSALTDTEDSLQWSKLAFSSIIYLFIRTAERALGLNRIWLTKIRAVPFGGQEKDSCLLFEDCERSPILLDDF